MYIRLEIGYRNTNVPKSNKEYELEKGTVRQRGGERKLRNVL